MITGIYQSIPIVFMMIAYYVIDTWMMRRYTPKRTLVEKRDRLNTTVTFIAIVFIVLQPLLMPWLGLLITARWGLVLQILGVIILLLGMLLIIWVRLHLKNLFSERVELQEGHYLVNTGPYALIRHPLYSAFFLMLFGLLMVKPGIIELCLFGFAFWHFSKLAKEEDVLLSKELPGYKEYMAVTPSFVPTL